MSQHTYATAYQGQEVRIMMGFDRQLQGFFMDIDAKSKFESIPIYACSKDPALQSTFGMSGSIDHFCKKLVELELTIPETMLLAIQKDAEDNAGNVVIDHGSSFAPKPKYVRPLKVGQLQGGGVYASTFSNGRLALYLGDGLSGRISINVPEVDLQDTQTLVKMAGASAPLRDELLSLGIFTDTGNRHQVGFDELELWQVDRGTIASLLS